MNASAGKDHPRAFLLPLEIEGIDCLMALALDVRWSWNHSNDFIWRQLDPILWERTHNPWAILSTTSRDKLKQMLADPRFRKMVEGLLQAKKQDDEQPGWFQQNYPSSPLSCVAYFSMEYMLSEALPIYSGGLGNVAGDQLKAASNLGVPIVGVGLLYQQGYFRQLIDKDGAQQALFPYNSPEQLPIIPLRGKDGQWIQVEIPFPGFPISLRAWEVQVGKVKLYLLDSNDPANFPEHRGITSELYGGGPELRLKQEIVLGIGGWRLLEILGFKPEVCHLNEGHAALAVLERAKSFMKATGQAFEVALTATRVGNLFTTHTAVPAGFDVFPPFLIKQYLSKYAETYLGLSLQNLLALGRQDPNNSNESFNMAYLAVRGSGAINGVSRLHGVVSRRIFSSLFPRWPEEEVPIEHVTNGVHIPTWDSVAADTLWTEHCGKKRWMGTTETMAKSVLNISDTPLWQMRNACRKALIEYARARLAQQLEARGSSAEEVEQAKHLFDVNTLTLGFARRFATYKRPNLLLHNPERLLSILTHAQRPIQLFLAGKAHPADQPGQQLIRQWFQFIMSRPEARRHVVFLSDYDVNVTEQLVGGVDVWLNTPRRPWEACGTSGMKVLVNGGLNLSELDGWWAEAYSEEVGWALGDGQEHGDNPGWDAYEAERLYDLLEKEVAPEFYNRDAEGIPTHWVERMRASMATLTPNFSADRTVRDYTEHYYLPAATAFKMRTQANALFAKQLVEWQHILNEKWSYLRFADVKVTTDAGKHQFETQVYLDAIDPNAVKVELYSRDLNNGPPQIQELKRIRQLSADPSTYVYSGAVSATRPATDYTLRVVPSFKNATIPLEATHILWQH